jgi:hypothetical protein
MKIVSYLNTVPAKNNNMQKTELLIKYIMGVNKVGDIGQTSSTTKTIDSDVAVIQGWVYDNISSPHLKLRKEIIDTQTRQNKYVVSADANLFLYNNKVNPHGYLRYSFNGIFPNTGIYCDDVIDQNRWNQISNDTGITLENYKTHGRNIVIMLQRNGGWSMGVLDVQDWAVSVIQQIRQYSDRPIIIRAHPGDRQAKNYLHTRTSRLKNLKNVRISLPDTTLSADLSNAWAVVNHNSSAVVGPIIQGYYSFVTDPQKSQCAEVSNTNLSLIETPSQFDRQRWLERISMFHWKFSELEDGKCWSHMRNYVRQ